MLRAPLEFNHGEVQLLGYSMAGEETYLVLPTLNIGFDFGRAPREVVGVDHVFLSHGHMDHAAGVAYYFSQRMFIDNAPGHAYVPEPLVDPISQIIRLWGQIDGNEPPAHVHAARPDEDVTIRRGLIVRPFAVNHPCRGRQGRRVDGLGFSVIEIRKKLKEEYLGLMGPQIVELKKQGVEIERYEEVPLVTYCGDTAPGAFLERDHVRNSQVLILECTFIDAEHRSRARAGNHLHIDDLRTIAPRLNNERILLNHLTRRTALRDARRRLSKVLRDAGLPDDDRRFSFLAEHRRRRHRSQAPENR
jgi:ribonuclease Z